MNQKVAVRGLAHLSAWMFAGWGALMVLKGLWDCFGGEPEANHFSPAPWQFVTRDQWFRYAGFELCYGLACLGMAAALRVYGRRLPVFVERPLQREESHG